MIRKIYNYVLFICLTSNCCFATNIDEIHWMFQETLPYSFVDEKTNINKGMAIDILDTVFKKLNAKINNSNYTIAPFARGIYELKSTSNTAFFPIAKTPERIMEFKWVGPIGEYNPVIWAKKSKKVTPKEVVSILRTYTIGTKAHSIINKLIMDQGFDGSNVYQGTLDEENIKKLYFDRIDLVACDYLQGVYLFNKLGYNINDYEVIYHLPKLDYAIAFSLDVSDDFITKLQNTLNELRTKTNGISAYDTILKSYQVQTNELH